MININFFEKKEKNMMPYLVMGLFFIFLSLIILYLFFARTYYQDTIADKSEWMNQHAEELALSTEMEMLDKDYQEAIILQEELEETQLPVNLLLKDISNAIPDNLIRLSSFQYLRTNQLSLHLENTDVKKAQEIVENIESLPYVKQIQLLSAQSQNSEEDSLSYELVIDINEELIGQEEAK